MPMEFIFAENALFSIIKTFLISFFTLGMIITLTDFKYSKKRVCLIFTLYLTWVLASTVVLVELGGFVLVLRLFLITITAPGLLITYCIAKDSPAQAAFLYMTQINFSLICGMTITILNTAIHGTEASDLALRFISYVLIIALQWKYLRHSFRRLTAVIRRGWSLLFLIPVAFCILIVVVALYPNHFLDYRPSIIYVYSIALTMAVVYVVLFQSLLYLTQLQILTQEKELLSIQVSSMTDMAETIYKAEEKQKIERHDMRHRLRTLAELIQKEDYGAALDYIGDVDSKLSTAKPIHYCENVIIDAILSFYFSQARQNEIALSLQLDIPKDLPINAAELSIVIANALENAIAACKKLPIPKRVIRFRCASAPMLILEISNPYEGMVILDSSGLPVSKQKGHGIGTRSIAAFAKKYHAVCIYETAEGWFNLHIAL